MEIRNITENKKQFLDLLLLGDESESMIGRYLSRGELFALYDDELKAVCVVTQEDNTTCELKNIAVYPQYQRQGYGAALMGFITNHYKGKYETMILGTGDVPSILSFYKKCGFEPSHRIKNFFTDNYNHPMFEEGVQLIDMVYLKKEFEIKNNDMRFNNVRLLVQDYKKSFKFYTEKLGLEPAWGDENSGYASFKVAAGIEGLAIFVSDWMAEAIGNVDKQIPVDCREKMIVVLNVDNVDKEYQVLKERGIEFINEPHDMPGWGARVVHFYDPENNLIELFCAII